MEEEVAILIYVITVVLLTIMIIGLFLFFNKKKNSLVIEKKEELAKAQLEIREETLRNISWELHDNIGQLITLAKINAQMAQTDPTKLDAVITSVDLGLKELRLLSRTINPEFINKMGLTDAIELEVERYNRLEFIKADLEIEGRKFKINKKHETILFRILQEFFTNTIKHSRASRLLISILYSHDFIEITVSDNGIGFSDDIEKGLGLANMKNRADLIGAEFKVSSNKDKGTELYLKYYT